MPSLWYAGSPRKQGWHQPRLGFSGPTVLEDDHTSGGALDVDERGFPRTPSNRRPTSSDEADLPVPPESNGTPGTAGSTTVRAAGGLHPVAEHPLQQAEGEAGAAEGRASGAAGAAGAALTTASWRMARWWGDYADLMR